MIVVEGLKSVHIAASAWLVEENRELAWAEKHVVRNPAYAWVLGKYVGTNKANDNGHIFDAEELSAVKGSLVHAPMNMLHRPQAIMGVYVANEVVYPIDAANSATVAAGHEAGETEPFLEALAAFWKYYFPEEYSLVEKAHAEGTLAWSMECVPETVTCAGDHPDCGKTFAYAGRQSETYCAHLNEPAAPKRMGKPHFTAGALVVPPARPAWRNASVTELDSLVRRELEAAESLYHHTTDTFPHLSEAQWTAMMGELVALTAKSDAREERRSKQHTYRSVHPGQDNAPCKDCGKKKSDPLHPNTANAERIGREQARTFSAEQRKKLAGEGKAKSDGSFPIENAGDLRNAIQAVGRAKNPAAAKAHIVRRAKALGLTKLLPDGWR
jgi:hypothetical protein